MLVAEDQPVMFRRTWWALGIMALLILAGRLRTIDEPLEDDLVTYVTIGHEMLDGERLYSDVWDVKPPGLYIAFALGVALFGHDRCAFGLGLLCAWATLLLVYKAAHRFGAGAALTAAAFWTLLSGSMMMQANQPNTEAFLNVFCVGAFILIANDAGHGSRRVRYLCAGLLFAVGSTFKPLPVFPAGLLVVAHVLWPPGVARKTALLDAVMVGCGGLAVWAGIFGYAALSGQAEIYWGTNITMNAERSTSALFNLYRYIREGLFVPRYVWFLVPLVLIIAVAAVEGLKSRRREWILYAAWVLGVHAMIFIPGGAFHPHGYQLWLPLAAVGAAWAMAEGRAWVPLHLGSRRWPIATVAGIVAAAVVIAHELPNYFLPADEWARSKYGERVVADRAFSRAVGELLQPNETVFHYGNGAALYYYARKRPGTVILWASFLMHRGSVTDRLSRQTLAQLQASPPDLFAIQRAEEWVPGPVTQEPRGLAHRLLSHANDPEVIGWREHPIHLWAMENYSPWPREGLPDQNRMTLLVRNGSDLQRRLRPR